VKVLIDHQIAHEDDTGAGKVLNQVDQAAGHEGIVAAQAGG
jgi:hypothetical protein